MTVVQQIGIYLWSFNPCWWGYGG